MGYNPFWRLRRHSAICRASHTSRAVIRDDIDQPITARDHRSITTAKIQPALIGANVGDVLHPLLIRCAGGEILIQQIIEYRQIMGLITHRTELTRGFGPNPCRFRLAATVLMLYFTLFAQLISNARCAVALFRLMKGLMTALSHCRRN